MATSDVTYPTRLSRIDETTRGDHYHLEPSDTCLYVGDYTARKGFSHSHTNQLILNLKKSIKERGNAYAWQYKGQAIREVARTFQRLIPVAELQRYTLVPMPPSKGKNDPLYDDRMVQVVRLLAGIGSVDARELLHLTNSLQPSHDSESRPSPHDLAAIMEVDPGKAEPPPIRILLFDDVLVAGAHFKAAKMVLQDRFGPIPVIGVFAARRVIDADPPDDLEF